jgi:drug/metabolite transporter (DMT)-like permease
LNPPHTVPTSDRWRSIALLLLIAVLFGANHVAARLTFDHGTGVTFAVAVRSAMTALVLMLLLTLSRPAGRLTAPILRRALLVGLLVSFQSFCLYSAVARIPVALALLVFNTFPMVLGLLSWATGAERPHPRAMIAMPVALVGLAIALDVFGWAPAAARASQGQIGIGVAFAMGASLSMGMVLLLTTKWLSAVDGRMRTLILMSVVALVTFCAGMIGGGFAPPADGTGWLGLALLTAFYGIAITVLFTVLPKMGAVNNAAILNFEPVAALILGWLILGQSIAASQLFGGVIVIAAIVVLTTGKR